ncbi:hypothetical protein ACQY1Q_01560 [Tenacibaculum sp. TC6]|uniref:hypothetical protein n=1 Tax=Tenacibaculum sp. TC6 TaxID=3423223 RepID=UPI003D35C6A9
MINFKEISIENRTSEEVTCQFFEHEEENILLVKLAGVCSVGSSGENYGAYLYQKIGLALLTTQPNAVLVDLQELEYQFGDRISLLFQVFSQVRIFDEEEIITAFVCSDKNKLGLASLLQFDLENPAPPFFYDLQLAYKTLYEQYDRI